MFIHNFSHFMEIWFLPPGLVLLPMLIGLVLMLGNYRSGKLLVVSAFLMLWSLSSPMCAQYLIGGLQSQYSPVQPAAHLNEKDSAIVVLAYGVDDAREYDKKDVLSDKSMQRVNYAAYLNKQTHIPLIVSGGNRDNIGRFEADMMQEMLEEYYHLKVAAAEAHSHNTQEQSQLIIPILKQKNIHTIYLVTNAWHMPRSMYTFQNALKPQGLTVIAAPMGYISLKSGSFVINLLPSIHALQTSVYAIYEYIGIGWYHIQHSIKTV
jgi:uncharacterized SAM-binding protein YcdF (DUF218 family)